MFTQHLALLVQKQFWYTCSSVGQYMDENLCYVAHSVKVT